MTRTPCACTRARRAARSLTNHYDSALKPVGLRITQFSVLSTIDRMAPVNVSALAEAMLDWANPILEELFRVEKGRLIVPDRPGCGIEWDEKAISKYSYGI